MPSSVRIDVGIRYGAGMWPDLMSSFLLRDEFFPVCGPSLVEGPNALKQPSDLKNLPLIDDTSMSSSVSFPHGARGCCTRAIVIREVGHRVATQRATKHERLVRLRHSRPRACEQREGCPVNRAQVAAGSADVVRSTTSAMMRTGKCRAQVWRLQGSKRRATPMPRENVRSISGQAEYLGRVTRKSLLPILGRQAGFHPSIRNRSSHSG
ncbi:hypothetical protein [Paraburkholderia sp. RAU2J]|uniref:hypothetical protein n=1 Tax=Paraburkholderia sp. RAU2J TaxID=1938810 RepID=UPI0018F5C682|nr:hypothetical protein [Paraburkholderia sp. RAU2J]